MSKKLLVAKPIEKELETFVSLYRESISTDDTKIQEIVSYTFKSDGKMIRPILLLLAAKACGTINQTTYSSAITIELLHSASLIHDDVVDESLIRRGKPSMNAVFGNKTAVLVGDYFLSTALIKSVETGNLKIIFYVSALGKNLAEGELSQLSLAKDVILDEEQYFDVIRKKTASLLSACMKIGALSVNATNEQVILFEELGESFGICFQLRDDIFDYYSADVGKPTGNDIREGKVTLPLLYSLRNSNIEESEKMLSIIKKADFSEDNIQLLINFAKNNGGIDYAYDKISFYKERALLLIDKLPPSDIRDSLSKTLDYIIERRF